jgi:hypothetical protein
MQRLLVIYSSPHLVVIKKISLNPRHSWSNTASFYDEDLLVPHQNSKLEKYPLSAVRECLFNTYAAAAFHIGGRFSIRSLRMRHAVATWPHTSRKATFSKSNIEELPQMCWICSPFLTLSYTLYHDRNSSQSSKREELLVHCLLSHVKSHYWTGIYKKIWAKHAQKLLRWSSG